MSYYQQQNRQRLSVGQDGNSLTTLLLINITIFSLLAFVKVVYYFSFAEQGKALFNEQVFRYATLPASLETFISRPWTLLTHMFVHDTADIWQLVGNMLWLWAFGFILQDLAGAKKLVPLYIYGGLAGAVAYVLVYNFIPQLNNNLSNAHILGASAGVMAVAIGTTALSPNYRIFPMLNGGIPIWVLTVLYVVIDFAALSDKDPGANVAHLVGAGSGFLFVWAWGRGYDAGAWMNNFFDWVNNLFNPDKPRKGVTPKTTLYYKSTVPPYKKSNLLTQQRVDEILDKISQKGYNALTEDEKEMLKRASQEDML